ncbi:MAG: hypothetical protein WBA31_10890, partial [Candidatus Dormiibacterota bacterium]
MSMEAKFGESGPGAASRRTRRSAVVAPKRRWRRWVAGGVGLLLLALAIDLPLAYLGSGNAKQQVHRVDAVLAKYQREGVPAASLRPLQDRLIQVQSQAWFSPTFWLQARGATIASVRRSAQGSFTEAVADRRSDARSVLSQYRRFLAGNSAWLTQDQAQVTSSWSADLTKAQTPDQLLALTKRWKGSLTTLEAAAQSAKAADAATITLTATSPTAQATEAEGLAQTAGLSELQVPAALNALQKAIASGQPTTTASANLSTQVEALRAELGLQDQLQSTREAVLNLVDQAAFEAVPGAATFQSQYTTAKSALTAAANVTQLGAANGALQSLQGSVQKVLAANACGHTSLAGKSIYISLSLEEMVF